jgi:hypothetical protein
MFLVVRHEVALDEWSVSAWGKEEFDALPDSGTCLITCSQSRRALLVTAGYEARDNAEGACEPSAPSRLGKDWIGERK